MAGNAWRKMLIIKECKEDIDVKFKTLHYLENVEKEKEISTEIDLCIVCRENVTKVCGNTNLYV